MTRLKRWLPPLLLAATLMVGGALCAYAQVVIVPKAANPNQLISFSFQQADIDDVLRFLATASGKIVFKDPSVQTQVTIRNESQIKVSEAIKIIQTLLSLKGYALVEDENSIIVKPKAQAGQGNTPVSIGKDLASIPTGKQVITHIFPLSTVDAVKLREELAPLFPQGGSATILANGDTNSLIVVDEADNVRRIGQIINQVDREQTDEITLEVIPLKYADASEVANYMTELFRPDTNVQQQAAPQFPGQPGAAAANQRGSLAQLRGRVRFAADRNSNSLLVYATPGNIKTIRSIIASIDVNTTARSEYRIVELKNADANAMADQLNQILNPTATTGNRGGGFFGGGGFGGGGFGGGGGAPGSAASRSITSSRIRGPTA